MSALVTYPAISLWQPYATALFTRVSGERMKGHETRHWPAPARLIGKRVAIHAAKRRIGVFDLSPSAERALRSVFGEDWRKALPYGAVIGTARLVTSLQMRDGIAAPVPENVLDRIFGNWEPGRYAWRMDDPVLLPEPIPCVGRQGWFSVKIPEVSA